MASNYNNPYNYPNYQQSSGQQYATYQTAPAPNTLPQTSRQYQQQSAPVPTTQATDYMSYQSSSYNNRSATNYGGAQDPSWSGANTYGGQNRETARGAAEVLHNMSNTYNAPATTGVSNAGFTPTNVATSSRYTNASTQQQPQQQPQATRSPAYVHAQPRPRSVNTTRPQNATANANRGLPSPATTAGYPSQRATALHNQQQQQRSASPAQPQYTHPAPAPASSSRTTGLTTSAQYDYSNRQLPNVEATRTTPPHSTIPVANTYNYTDAHANDPIAPPPASNNVPEQYNQNTATTVDPMAVYDPWPEYQRKAEAARAQKAVEDAARAEQERIAAEAKRAEDERKAEEERKKKEEEERARQAAKPKQPQQRNMSRQEDNVAEAGPSSAAEGPTKEELEAQIREMMAKMREFNSKDPALLARIWEEERKAKGPKSPTTQTNPTSQAIATAPVAAQPVQATVPHAANQRKRARPKEVANGASGPRTPAPVAAPAARMAPPPARPSVKSGNTVWPEEKKGKLAVAAAQYLNERNPAHTLTSDSMLALLNSDPSYLDLCELLEAQGLKLDRAAFAKFLLEAVPDVNSSSRQNQSKAPTVMAQRAQAQPAPPAIVTAKVATPMAPSPAYTPAAPLPLNRSSYPPFPDDNDSASPAPAPVAEMVPIKPELKTPANKEEAARKRNFNDLIDLTAVIDDDEPPFKRHNAFSPAPLLDDAMDLDQPTPVQSNFPAAISIPSPAPQMAPPTPANEYRFNELRARNIVQPLDKKNALRRNGYNIGTIARDVLLACGRHPDERQLNAHLEILKINLPQVDDKSDLSTLRWDLIDPGEPPRGYYKSADQSFVAEDADDEEESEDESAKPRPITAAGVSGGEAAAEASVQILPPGTNPFKQKRRGRPPRQSLPAALGHASASSETPSRPTTNTNMSASAPRPSAGSVGYSAFRAATEYGPDGKPLPKKKGRPVGWRKAIHGSPSAQLNPGANGHTGALASRFIPHVPSALRNEGGSQNQQQPIMISSRSPSLARQSQQFQSFKCKWNNCKSELHNLETLKKHVHKVHRKETLRGTIDCLWSDCGKEVTVIDKNTNMRTEKHVPFSFGDDGEWKEHLELQHFGPLAWELGDGPASGLSDAHDSEAYLSDAQGRRVTPRITVDPARIDSSGHQSEAVVANASPAPRGRGRPPKSASKENEAQEARRRLLAHKKRIGGVGMDRGGATLAIDKRRKGLTDEEPEEFVDAE